MPADVEGMTLSTLRTTVVLAAVALFVLFGVRPLLSVALTLRAVWLETLLPALTLAAPVGVPMLGGALLFLAVVRLDTRR